MYINKINFDVTNTQLTTCEFFAPKLALCTINFLSPNCIPFNPAHPCSNTVPCQNNTFRISTQ